MVMLRVNAKGCDENWYYFACLLGRSAALRKFPLTSEIFSRRTFDLPKIYSITRRPKRRRYGPFYSFKSMKLDLELALAAN